MDSDIFVSTLQFLSQILTFLTHSIVYTMSMEIGRKYYGNENEKT